MMDGLIYDEIAMMVGLRHEVQTCTILTLDNPVAGGVGP